MEYWNLIKRSLNRSTWGGSISKLFYLGYTCFIYCLLQCPSIYLVFLAVGDLTDLRLYAHSWLVEQLYLTNTENYSALFCYSSNISHHDCREWEPFPHLLQFSANGCLVVTGGISGSFLLGAFLAIASRDTSSLFSCFNTSCCSFTTSH